MGVIFLVRHTIMIPEEVDAKLKILAKTLSVRQDHLVVFAIIRLLEVQGWILRLWR